MGDNTGYDGGNTTGFASPAGDSLEGPIDLSEILDLRRPNRYPVRVLGKDFPPPEHPDKTTLQLWAISSLMLPLPVPTQAAKNMAVIKYDCRPV